MIFCNSSTLEHPVLIYYVKKFHSNSRSSYNSDLLGNSNHLYNRVEMKLVISAEISLQL